ncbi:hypothetical protein Q8A73_019497 [Channa argus]|nr:hypothetical protein Q8A73_019497 [Channa argus]
MRRRLREHLFGTRKRCRYVDRVGSLGVEDGGLTGIARGSIHSRPAQDSQDHSCRPFTDGYVL